MFIFFTQEFSHMEDTYYLAHCYPYTFTDLKDDLDDLLAEPQRSKVMKREVMCETRAGNSCFLLTVTNFGKKLFFKEFNIQQWSNENFCYKYSGYLLVTVEIFFLNMKRYFKFFLFFKKENHVAIGNICICLTFHWPNGQQKKKVFIPDAKLSQSW